MRPSRDLLLDTLRAKPADVHVRLPQTAHDALRTYAEREGVSVGAVVRWLVLEGLRALDAA